MAEEVLEATQEEVKAEDAFAGFIFSARRATSLLNSNMRQRGMSSDDINDWLTLRLLQAEGPTQLNKIAWSLALERKDMLGNADRLQAAGLVDFADESSIIRFHQTVAITEKGQQKLTSYEDGLAGLAKEVAKIVSAPRLLSYSRDVGRVARGLSRR